MATKSIIEQFDISKITWEQFDFSRVYREELGTASILSIKQILDAIGQKIKRADRVKGLISDEDLNKFYSTLNSLIEILQRVSKLTEAQFVGQKQQIINAVNSENEQLLRVWPQVVAIINDTDKNVEIDKTLDEIQHLKQKTLEDSKNIQQIKEALTADLKAFEERYKNEIFNKAEIIKQEDAFSKDAIEFRNGSKFWFWGIIVTLFILMFVLYLAFKYFCFELTCFDKVCNFDYDTICKDCNRDVLYLEIFKSVTYRLLLISFLSYLLGICVKNYNANMHNYTVNKHKANSLSAALVLLDKAKTPDGNDQLMTQAANAIFSHQPTGFNNREPKNIGVSIIEKLSDKVKI